MVADDAPSLTRQEALRQALPTINAGLARKLVAFFIERAHAERADPKAVQNGLEPQIVRLLQKLANHEPLVSVRVPAGAANLLNLRAPNYDGCLFDPSKPLGRGGQGAFFVGITPHKHALAVKMMLPAPEGSEASRQRDFAREAATTRRASRFDVLQLICTPTQQFMVMPLFNGDLKQHAAAFLRLAAGPGEPGCQGLFGARYVLRSLLGEVDHLHRSRRVMHQDIKANNVFLQRDWQRFILGDLGMASRIGDNGQARPRGYTPTLAAPEQFGRAEFIGPKVDVFGLATTMFELLTTQCPQVVAYRRARYPQQSAAGLFPYETQVPQMHAAHRQMVFGALDGTGSPNQAAEVPMAMRGHMAHFESIHRSVDACDLPLGHLLRRMLQHDPSERPSTGEAIAHIDYLMHLSAESLTRIQEAWNHDVPKYAPPVEAALRELHGALDTMTLISHAQATS